MASAKELMNKAYYGRESSGGVWIAELDRFGYTLRAFGKSRKEAVEAVMESYLTAYKNENGTDARKDFCDRYGNDGQTYFDAAMDDMEVDFQAFGKCEWT